MSFTDSLKKIVGGGDKPKKPKKPKAPKPESLAAPDAMAANPSDTATRIIESILLGRDPLQVHTSPSAPPSAFAPTDSTARTPFGLPQELVVPLSIAAGLLLILALVKR